MKALILSAGFGTRLLPYTKTTPKPLFTIDNKPLLDIIIEQLIHAGCKDIIINTHHLAKKINDYILSKKYSARVTTIFEPEILGTGGAIKNISKLIEDQPFFVINSDIYTNINLSEVYRFHKSHPFIATLILYDCKKFNTVTIDSMGFIKEFNSKTNTKSGFMEKNLTFTGIQVIDPIVLHEIKTQKFSTSIELYKKLILQKNRLKGFIANKASWIDIGTCESYKETAKQITAKTAFKKSHNKNSRDKIAFVKIQGDGSDRIWSRLHLNKATLIMAEHGIRTKESVCEIDSFINIGNHLYKKNIPVPKIYHHDNFSGLVFVEDLGDKSLKSYISKKNSYKVLSAYRSVIDILINMSVKAKHNFDPSWTYQTAKYNKNLIINSECFYFFDAFIKNYLKINISKKEFIDDFSYLADETVKFAINGFMHRDFQSKNIMVKHNKFYIIDFQGGRTGPIQYDLASLLIDPYVNLDSDISKDLFNYCLNKFSSIKKIDKKKFEQGFKLCSLTRNLQILGAFAYLSKVKGKTYFEKYIPLASKTLAKNIIELKSLKLKKLEKLIRSIL